MRTIGGSRCSGSGTIVRQAVAFSALTGQSIRVINARTKRVHKTARAKAKAKRSIRPAKKQRKASGAEEEVAKKPVKERRRRAQREKAAEVA